MVSLDAGPEIGFSWRVAAIDGTNRAWADSQQRRAGFEDAVTAAGFSLVGTQSGQWETERANAVAAGLRSEHPDLTGILCANDSMALGAVAAIQAANRRGQVLVVCFDNVAAIRPLIEDGRVIATADQHGDQLAGFGIEAALEMLGGKGTPADRTTAINLIKK